MADDLTLTPPNQPEPTTTTVVPPNLVPAEPAMVATPVAVATSVPPMPLPVIDNFIAPQPTVAQITPEPSLVAPDPVVSEPIAPAVSPTPVVEDLTLPTVSMPTDDQVNVPTADSSLPSDGTSDLASEASDDDKKSPLEILEEILAGANAEQDLKTKEEEEKKKKEEEEKAVFEAKKQVFADQAKERMAETKTALQEATAVRDLVEADIKEKDKNLPGELGDEFVISQLTHDTIQTTE